LKAVRDRRDQARRLIAQGVDRGVARKAQKASRSEVVVNSFEAVAREWRATIHISQVSAGHAARPLIRLEQDVFPWLGGLPVGEIKAPQLLQIIRRIEARGAIETAHRALQACGQVCRYAIATSRAERDPAPDLRGALKPVLVQHMAAITDPKRVGELLRAIESYKGMPITRAALQLAPPRLRSPECRRPSRACVWRRLRSSARGRFRWPEATLSRRRRVWRSACPAAAGAV
jgi:integrase